MRQASPKIRAAWLTARLVRKEGRHAYHRLANAHVEQMLAGALPARAGAGGEEQRGRHGRGRN